MRELAHKYVIDFINHYNLDDNCPEHYYFWTMVKCQELYREQIVNEISDMSTTFYRDLGHLWLCEHEEYSLDSFRWIEDQAEFIEDFHKVLNRELLKSAILYFNIEKR